MQTTPKTELYAMRGDNENYDITLTDDNDNPISVAGATVKLTIKKVPSDANALLTKDGVIVDGANGELRVSIGGAEWDNLPAGQYHYDVQVTFSNGDVFTALVGKLNVEQDMSA